MSCGCHSVKKPVLGRYLLIWQVRKAGSNFEVSKRKTGTRSDFHNCNWNWTQFFSKKEMDPGPSFLLYLCLELELEWRYMFFRTNCRLTDKLVPVLGQVTKNWTATGSFFTIGIWIILKEPIPELDFQFYLCVELESELR